MIDTRQLVEAVHAQQKGIGRVIKSNKEAIIGILTALEERQQFDLTEWRKAEAWKVSAFLNLVGTIKGLAA